jgi:hypothetical protein
MAWRVARSISLFHGQLRLAYPRAAPPATHTSSWGTIGDAAHNPKSDHAPHNFPGWGNEIVTAGDAPHRPDLGLDMHTVCEALRRSRDPRIKYVIFNRRMFSSYSGSSFKAWDWRPYSNAANDPHTDHGHLSTVGDPRADGTTPWMIGVDMDLNAVGQIIPGLPNATVLADIWRWGATVRFGEAAPRGDDRFSNPTWPGVVGSLLDEIKDRPQVEPAPVDVAALAAALAPHLEAAAERAVRRVLGGVDGASPPVG